MKISEPSFDELPPVPYQATNGRLARAEYIALGSVIDAGNVPLPPFLEKLIQNAPKSFDDQRSAELAVSVRETRDAGEPLSLAIIGEKNLPFLNFITSELANATLPLDAAEYYAERCWQAFQVRRARSIGEDFMQSLESSPELAGTICDMAITALTGLKESSEGQSLADRLAQRAYDPEAKLERPLPRFSVKNVTVATAGNLTTISAQAKAGKTATKGAMIASTFADMDADCLAFVSSNPHGHAIIDIDTEQSPFDHAELNRLISKRAGKPLPPWYKSFCLTGWTANDIRRAIPVLLAQGKKDFGGVHSLFIDGVADCANDVNDPAEANGFVAELHGLAIEYDCTVPCIIHLNPGSDFKTRGHLGSQLERKAETNLKCEKDESEIITVWAEKNRHANIPKKTAPRFAWNAEAGMHLSVESAAQAKEELEFQELSELFEKAFSDRPAMHYSDLKVTVMKCATVKDRAAEKKIALAVSLRIVKKTVAGLYELRT